MTISAPPFVECDQVHPVLVVSDIACRRRLLHEKVRL